MASEAFYQRLGEALLPSDGEKVRHTFKDVLKTHVLLIFQVSI